MRPETVDISLDFGRILDVANHRRWPTDDLGYLAAAFAVHDVRTRARWESRLRVRRPSAHARRAPVLMSGTEAVLWALVEVRDVEAARALIARGIGRHRAFGLGWVGVRDGVARPEPWDPRPVR